MERRQRKGPLRGSMEAAGGMEFLWMTWSSGSPWGLWQPSSKSLGSGKFPEVWALFKSAKHKELAHCDENWLYAGPATRAHYWNLWGSAAQGCLQGQDQQRTSEKGGLPSNFSKGPTAWCTGFSKPYQGWKLWKRTKMGAANWQFRDSNLDRITGQVAVANKKH